MMTTSKTKSIETILKLTKKTGDSKYFDRLHEKDEKYLGKLLSTVKNLKRVK